MVNELTISFKNGVMTGVQVRGADGVARPIQAGDIAAQMAAVNEAALMRVSELATVEAEYMAFKLSKATVAESVRAIIADNTKSDAQSCAEIDALAAYELTNKRQRDRAAALVKLAEAQAEADKYD